MKYFMAIDAPIITLHAHVRAGGYVIRAGVHLYVDDNKKSLNGTLAVDFKHSW